MAKKQGLIERLMMGKEKSEDYARSTLPSNRWELFWDVFKGSFGKLFSINLLVLVFMLPIILGVFFREQFISISGTEQPFSQNIGVGYPAMPIIEGLAIRTENEINLIFFLVLPILAVVGAIGLSGGMYVIRNMVWTEGTFISSDFWRGVKQNFLAILGTTLIYTLVLFMINYSLSSINYWLATGFGSKFWLGFSRVMIYIALALFTIMYMYSLSISVTYKLSFIRTLKNSFLMTIGLLPQNVLFGAIAILPFILLFFVSSGFKIVVILLAVVLGFSFAMLVWTVYTQWVYDKFINDRVPGAVKNRGIYEKTSKSGESESLKKYRQQRKREIIRLNAERRAIKPIDDEEIVINELPINYGRADLERLRQEKEYMREDAERWAEEHKDDETAMPPLLSLEGFEDVVLEEDEPKKSSKNKNKNKKKK